MDSEDTGDRPSKRAKMSDTSGTTSRGGVRQDNLSTSEQKASAFGGPRGKGGKSNFRQQSNFSASGIHNDDVGIFVTSDRGQEKKCLQELSDLLGEFFQVDVDGEEDDKVTKEKNETDIEADINAELDSLRPLRTTTKDAGSKLSLVTLDIPCVSFVRFPSKTTVDPVHVVRKLCQTAADKESHGPRSRYIKRLTPISRIRKTLNDGLDNLCDLILPGYFQLDDSADGERNSDTSAPAPCKFAIRPTTRNNNKFDRDLVIRLVADKITALGHGKHTVDLKGYDKLVLVDIYRNVVGMSVVGSEFETLKRFNLAELHASHLDGDDKDG